MHLFTFSFFVYFICLFTKMWLLGPGTSEAARYLRRNGVTLFGVKDEIIKLLGKADKYFCSPEHRPLTRSAQKALNWAIIEKNRVGNFLYSLEPVASGLEVVQTPLESVDGCNAMQGLVCNLCKLPFYCYTLIPA